jgi:hypothetical protein
MREKRAGGTGKINKQRDSEKYLFLPRIKHATNGTCSETESTKKSDL